MLRNFLFLFIYLNLSFAVYAKEVFDTNLNLSCEFVNNSNASQNNNVSRRESITIDIKKIDFNKDTTKPPKWGSVQNIKISLDGITNEASLLLSTNERLVFSFVNQTAIEGKDNLAQVYELDTVTLKMKKTTISLFTNSGNSIKNTFFICKKI